MNNIGVIGGGAWGTALAQSLASTGKKVTIWAREPEVISSINNDHVNAPFLPGIQIDASIKATQHLADAVTGMDAILIVSPAQYLRSTLEGIKITFLQTSLSSFAPRVWKFRAVF